MDSNYMNPILRMIANREYVNRERSAPETLESELVHSINYVLEDLDLMFQIMPFDDPDQVKKWMEGVARKLIRELHRSGYAWGFVDGNLYSCGLSD